MIFTESKKYAPVSLEQGNTFTRIELRDLIKGKKSRDADVSMGFGVVDIFTERRRELVDKEKEKSRVKKNFRRLQLVIDRNKF